MLAYILLCYNSVIIVAIVFDENHMVNIIVEVCAVCAAIGLILSGEKREAIQHARDDTAAQKLRITTVQGRSTTIRARHSGSKVGCPRQKYSRR